MPIIIYKCPECGHTFEKLCKNQKENQSKVECPKCKKKALRTLAKFNFRM